MAQATERRLAPSSVLGFLWLGGNAKGTELDFVPGDRVNSGRDGDVLVILLAGGTKKRQQRDIEAAQARWASYKLRKRSAR